MSPLPNPRPVFRHTEDQSAVASSPDDFAVGRLAAKGAGGWMQWEHAAEARAALDAIVSDPEHGVQVLSSPQTMSNLLKDLLPDAPREKSLLVAAAEAGLADTLREHVSEGMDPSTAIQLAASSFSARSPMTPEACRWVTGEIAAAMGIASPGDLGSDDGTSGGARQAASGGSAAGYSGVAPTRDHALRPARQASASAHGSGRAAPGSLDKGLEPASAREAGWGARRLAAGQGAGQSRVPAFRQTSNPAYSWPQAQRNPPSYEPGPVAGFQRPAGYPQLVYQPGVPAWSGPAGYTGQKTNSLAVAALVCGIVQFFGFWLLGTIPAIILGHMARNQIRQRNEQGAGLALAGLILGYVGIGLTVIVVLIILAAVRKSAPPTGY